MGVVGAGFLQIVTPCLFVLPGIIAYRLFPHLDRPDSAYLMLVRTLIPSGLRGLILAAMAAALMSSLSSMINSTSTILTMDVYKRVMRPGASQHEMVRFGQWSGFAVLIISMTVAFYYTSLKGTFLFILVQEGFAYIAPPFAVTFTAGFLWRRANAKKAAMMTIALGFPFTLLLQLVLFPGSTFFLRPYANYLHRAFISWCFLRHRHDRDIAPDRAARPQSNKRHHLEPALRVTAAGRTGALFGVEGFPHLVAAVHQHRFDDLRALPLVPHSTPRDSITPATTYIAVQPPSTGSATPVIYDAASDARRGPPTRSR